MPNTVKKDFFDEDFYKHGKGGGHIRLYPKKSGYGDRLGDCFRGVPPETTILDIGGGLGQRAIVYGEAIGCDPYEMDISKWAWENSDLPKNKHFCSDILDAGPNIGMFDIVNLERAVTYLDPQHYEKAITNAVSMCKQWFVFNDITEDHLDQGLVVGALRSRKYVPPRKMFLNIFDKLPLKIDMAKCAIMRRDGWDCIWVFEVKR
jgi:hypothetical protein